MSRRALLDDDDEPAPRRSVEDLLEKMSTVMHYKTNRGLRWYARAADGKNFGEGLTAREAMERALADK